VTNQKRNLVSLLQEFSIPLIAGVFAALLAANLAPHWYHHWWGAIHGEHGEGVFDLGFAVFGHQVGLHFLVNDFFMVFFFGIAAKEITEACLPGGSLNPIKSAINPLLATLGGVLGPVAVFFALLFAWHGIAPGAFPEGWGMGGGEKDLTKGWGIPTATDIALAWLVARAVFGKGHVAVNFLLLLAVADDAIGLVIIAVFYGDPSAPARPEYLGLVALGMAIAFAFRKLGVKQWTAYIFIAGPIAWSGLMLAHLQPALALVPIVPCLPGQKRDTGLFTEADEVDVAESRGVHTGEHHSPLHLFEHQLKLFVDLGLFFFAFANAWVELAGIGPMTWIILAALVVGKTVGVSCLRLLARQVGFALPRGMTVKDLWMAGFVAALGLTVALFVAAAAFTDPVMQGQAKMGALFSGFVGLAAILVGRAVGVGRKGNSDSAESETVSEAA